MELMCEKFKPLYIKASTTASQVEACMAQEFISLLIVAKLRNTAKSLRAASTCVQGLGVACLLPLSVDTLTEVCQLDVPGPPKKSSPFGVLQVGNQVLPQRQAESMVFLSPMRNLGRWLRLVDGNSKV